MTSGFTTPTGLAGWATGAGPEVLLLHGGPGMTDYMQSLDRLRPPATSEPRLRRRRG